MQNQEPQIQEQAQPASAADTAPPADEASLKARLAEAETRAAEIQEAFLRAKADAENIRRRALEDIARANKFASEEFANALVPVKESLEKALEVDAASTASLKEGVDMTLKQLTAAFQRNKLTEINPRQGEKLDPNLHQAISMVPTDQEANTIVNVLQKGYMIADRLLRPALVTVSAQQKPG